MSKRKYPMSVIFLISIELLQSQTPHLIGNRQASCASSINDQKTLSDYLENISRTARINTNDLHKIRKIIIDFLNHIKDCAETEGRTTKKNKEKTQKTTLQDKLKNLDKNESTASESYQTILNEYYHPDTSNERKKELSEKITTRYQELSREAKKHHKKQEEYKILENYEQAAARIEQAMKPIEEPEKDRMTINNCTTVFTVTEKTSAQSEHKRLRNRYYASDFTPTGFYLPPNTNLTINVKQEKGTHLPKLIVDTYGRYGFYCPLSNKNEVISKCNGKENKANKAREIPLKEGKNTITDTSGGLIYIRYVHDTPRDCQASISFLKGMKPAPFFKLGETTHDNWLEMLEKQEYKQTPDVILEGRRVIIVVSRNNAIKYKDENPEELLRAADNIIRFQDEFSGLDGSSKQHMPNAHKYLMTQMPPRPNDPNVLGESHNYYTAYNEDRSIADIMTIKGLVINGPSPWHEIGHMHQQSEWTWEEINEPNANLYAWITKKNMGNPDDYDPEYYEKISEYLNLPPNKRNFNQNGDPGYDPNDIRLLFFKQLYKAYGEDFYKKLHRYTREHPKDLTTDKEKANYFMLAACQVSGNNLHDVFQHWGLITTKNADISHKINTLNLPEPDDKTKKILMPNLQSTDDKKWILLDKDKLKLNTSISINNENIQMLINTNFINKEEAKIKFIVQESTIATNEMYIDTGYCEFDEIIKGKNGIQTFEYPFEEKCTGYNKVDRGKGLIHRKIDLKISINDKKVNKERQYFINCVS